MKDGGIATLRIGEYLSDSLTGADFIACLYIDLAQVAVDGQVITMTYDDGVIVAGHYEYPLTANLINTFLHLFLRTDKLQFILEITAMLF